MQSPLNVASVEILSTTATTKTIVHSIFGEYQHESHIPRDLDLRVKPGPSELYHPNI